MLQLEKELRSRVDSLNKEKHDRVKRHRQLAKVDQKLCDDLCATPYYVPTGAVPTDEQLAEMEEHIKRLEEEQVPSVDLLTG